MKIRVSWFILSLVLVLTFTFNGFGQKEPTLLYSSLLNGMKLQADGQLKFDRVRGVDFPLPKGKTNENEGNLYNPDGGGKLQTAVKRDGQEIGRLFWYAEKLSDGFWNFISFRTKDNQYSYKITQAGNYELVFEVEGKVFYRFPFRVASSAGQPLALYGDWEDYGYLFYEKANPNNQLRFTTWLRNDAAGTRAVKGDIKIVRDSDGKVIAQAFDETYTVTLRPDWKREDFMFSHPRIRSGNNVTGGGIFYAKELLATDGNYTINFTLDNKPYGKYKFTVKGGQIEFQGRQIRGNGDSTLYIEGGREVWFIKKS